MPETFTKQDWLNGSPVSHLINDFNAIPADADLRELVFVSCPELHGESFESGELPDFDA